MGWNEPNKGKEPPDLDEIIKRLQQKIKRLVSGKKTPIASLDNKNSMGIIAGGVGIVALLIWIVAGIFIVDPAEQAAILRFGRYVETVGPGPHWIPRLIESKVVINVDKVSDYSYSAQMLTSDENLVSVAVAVQYRIGDLQAYLFNVTDPEESLRQATSSALRQVVGNTTLDQIITAGREAWGINVQDSLIKILNIYKTGIIIVNVSPQPARAPEHVQEAFDDAIKAQEDEKRFKEQAYAYQAKVIPIAQGGAKRILSEAEAYAEQVVLQAKGEVAEFLAILPEYLKAPTVTSERMYLEAMQQVFTNSSKIVVETKSNNVLYIPMDKSNTKQMVTPEMHAQIVGGKQAAQLSELEQLMANRNSVRPTERQVRNS